jgi:hypothetical protein
MTISAPVVPRETITLRIVVLDGTDGLYDTQLLLDHFRWETKTLCGPGTEAQGDSGVDAGGINCPDGGVDAASDSSSDATGQ